MVGGRVESGSAVFVFRSDGDGSCRLARGNAHLPIPISRLGIVPWPQGRIGDATVVPGTSVRLTSSRFVMPGPATVLLVDDNAEMRALLQKELTGRHRVEVAADGEEAWEQISEEPPDLLLCDAQMPGMSGHTLCKRIKKEADVPSIPVFLLEEPSTSDDDDPAVPQADEVLQKPFAIAEVRRHMDQYLPSRELPDLPGIGGDLLKKVVQLVDRQLHDPAYKVEDLAEEMEISRRHLTRRLKAEADMTPATLLRSRRIERAKKQLETDPDTIAEVGERVGFRSASHFSQVFQDEVGCTPSAYRERHAE